MASWTFVRERGRQRGYVSSNLYQVRLRVGAISRVGIWCRTSRGSIFRGCLKNRKAQELTEELKEELVLTECNSDENHQSIA